jgi:hypothetical protein
MAECRQILSLWPGIYSRQVSAERIVEAVVLKLARYFALAYTVVALVSGAYFRYRQAKEVGFIRGYVVLLLKWSNTWYLKQPCGPFSSLKTNREAKSKARLEQ